MQEIGDKSALALNLQYQTVSLGFHGKILLVKIAEDACYREVFYFSRDSHLRLSSMTANVRIDVC